MIKLSVVIITLNEERNIARCLKSVLSIADEILVIDSFSKDETCNICRSYGARILEHKFNNYTEQKNFAAQAAQYNHILSIDADEELSDVLIKEIQRVKSDFQADGYRFNRLNNYCGKWIHHSGWYPDRKLRLYDRTKGSWEGLYIHEKIELRQGSIVGFLKGDLLHYTYYTIQEHIAQANKFSGIGASSAISKGRKSNLLKVILFPFWRFLKNYFIRLGFLDGYYGLVVCLIISHENFLKYAKMIELQEQKKSTK